MGATQAFLLTALIMSPLVIAGAVLCYFIVKKPVEFSDEEIKTLAMRELYGQ